MLEPTIFYYYLSFWGKGKKGTEADNIIVQWGGGGHNGEGRGATDRGFAPKKANPTATKQERIVIARQYMAGPKISEIRGGHWPREISGHPN